MKTQLGPISHLHDLSFKNALSDVRVAKDFFTHYLPESLKPNIDWDSLKLCPTTFIDPELTVLHTDVLYEVSFKSEDHTPPTQQKGLIFLHAEHQKKPDKLMPWRMIKYSCRIIEQYLQTHQTAILPLVVPIVLYNGQKRYPYSVDIFDLFGEHKTIAQETMFSRFKLVDLTQIDDEEIKSHVWSGLMEILLKHVESGRLLEKLELFQKTFTTLVHARADHYLLTMIKYVLQKGEINDRKALFNWLNTHLTPELEKETMTIAEQLRQEGMQEGIQKGIQEGLKKGTVEGEKAILKRLLERRFGQLPYDYLLKINNADAQLLLELSDKFMDAKNLDDIFKHYH